MAARLPCRSQLQSVKSIPSLDLAPHEKQQLAPRLPAPLIRHLFAEVRAGHLSPQAAALELNLHPSRFYQLRTDYLLAGAQGRANAWTPQTSGGDHHPDWPAPVLAQLTTLLSSQPPSSSSAGASELLRRLDCKTDRARVRRWALENNLAPDARSKKPPQPVQRWQARDLGALWPYDATPHPFLPGSTDQQCRLDLLDDATRFNTGARLDPGETLLAHLDFLSRSFQAHGLPLALSVDYHSFFSTHTPDAFTRLGAALHFYGVALRYAPTPQAQGKIERRHDDWQKRLPPLLAADRIHELHGANRLLDPLLPHANTHEIHRELGTPPQAAWNQAVADKRSVLRPAPACPWWPSVWSQRLRGRGAADGTVPVGPLRLSMAAAPRSTVIRCLRPDGDIFYLRPAPHPDLKPLVLLPCPVF